MCFLKKKNVALLMMMYLDVVLQMEDRFVFAPNDPRLSMNLNVDFRQIKGTPIPFCPFEFFLCKFV